jgi:uncharacterized protein (TIRG00374 family)
MPPHHRKIAFTLLKITVTGLSLYLLISLTDFSAVRRVLASASMGTSVFAAGLVLCSFLAGGLRWWLLLRHAAGHISFPQVLPTYYLGLFFNNILPTTMGGDAVRTVHLGLRGLSLKALVGSAVMDRGVGLLVVVGMGIICLPFAPEISLATRDKLLLVVTATLLLAGIALLFSKGFLKFAQRLSAKYQNTRVRRFLLDTLHLCHSYRTAHGTLLAATGLTVFMQSSVIMSYYLLARTVGIPLSLITYFSIIPLVFLAGALPVSLGGVGMREGALVALLAAVGIDTQTAITLSLLYLFAHLAASMPGGLVILLGRPRWK